MGIGGIQVGRLVGLRIGRFRELVLESGARGHGLDDAGIGGILAGHRAVHVPDEPQRIGVIALDRHPLERSDGHVHGVAQVVDLVGVGVAVGQGHHQAVHQGVPVVLGLVKGGTVRVDGRIAGRGMGGGSVQRIVDTAAAGIGVGAVEVAQVVADAQPLGHVEAELRAKIVTVVRIRVDVEHALFVRVSAGEQVADVVGGAAGRERVAGRGLDVLVQHVPPVGVGIIIIDVLAGLVLADDHPGAGGILHLVVATVPEFHHVGVGIVVQVGSVIGAQEQVAEIDGIVAAGLPVSGRRRGGETGAATVRD